MLKLVAHGKRKKKAHRIHITSFLENTFRRKYISESYPVKIADTQLFIMVFGGNEASPWFLIGH